MTREEAIAIISRPFDMSGVPSDILNAHKMAVEALEQESCEDTISRKAVLDIVNNPLNIRLDEIIKGLPSVTPANSVIEDIKAEIEQVKVIMNEEIIDNNRKDLINFVNGLNQCLNIIDKRTSGKENNG